MNHRAITFSGLELAPPAPRGRAALYIGVTAIHGAGDRERAVNQIDAEMTTLHRAAFLAMGVTDPDVFNPANTLRDPAGASAKMNAARAAMQQSPLYTWWLSVSPQFNEWAKFKETQGGLTENIPMLRTDWDEYTRWLDRVRSLRDSLRARGVGLSTPDPTDLSKSVVDAAAAAGKGVLDTIGDAIKGMGAWMKYVLYAALALAGGIGLVFILNELRSQAVTKAVGRSIPAASKAALVA